MKILLIAAIDENNVLGSDNRLIWHLPADLKFFKKTTLNHSIIMGRKTFESVGKALPQRKNIVISSQEAYKAEGCVVVKSLEEAIKQADTDEIFIVGGGVVFAESMAIAHQLYITKIHHRFEGDTFFPYIDMNVWEETWHEKHYKDDKHAYDFTFVIYKRRNNG